MDRDRLLRIRALVMHADSLMNAIPRPVPPPAPGGWEGQILDAEKLHEMYGGLPIDLRSVAGPGYELCKEALERQRDAAQCARSARTLLVRDVLEGTDLSADDLVASGRESPYPSPAGERTPGDHDLDNDDDNDAHDHDGDPRKPGEREPGESRAAGRTAGVIHLDDIRWLESDDEGEDDGRVLAADDADRVFSDPREERAAPGESERISRRLIWHGAAASVVAAASIAVLVWLSTRTPKTPSAAVAPAPAAAEMLSINRTARAGELTVIVSHAERRGDDADVHVHMVNPGARPQPTRLTLDRAPPRAETPSETLVVPPRSTRHRVMKLRRRSDKRPVVLRVSSAEDASSTVFSLEELE